MSPRTNPNIPNIPSNPNNTNIPSNPNYSNNPDTRASRDDLKRELQATLTARRELGPAYDEHFLDALVEKLTAQVQQQVQQQVRATMPRAAQRPPHDQRLGLAICSLIFGIPLVAIGTSFGPFGFFVVCLMIFGINVAFALMP